MHNLCRFSHIYRSKSVSVSKLSPELLFKVSEEAISTVRVFCGCYLHFLSLPLYPNHQASSLDSYTTSTIDVIIKSHPNMMRRSSVCVFSYS